jgi:hypothetical protein
MRENNVNLGAFRTAAAVSAAAFVMSACSGAPQGGFTALPVSSIASRSLGLSPPNRQATHPSLSNIRNALLVADWGSNGIEVFRPVNWSNRGRVTVGIKTPYGSWVDKNGSLYVANFGNPNVTEYNSNGDEIFAYGADAPRAVTTDGAGNVYVAGESGSITEYGQLSSAPTATCSPGGISLGVAVDKHRNVFVTYYAEDVHGIIEYPGGLDKSGCNAPVLPISLGYPGGMVIDPKGNLLVCDVSAGVIDVIAPPYTSITGTFGPGFIDPATITINRAATQAYIVEAGRDVRVLTYPGGALIALLNIGSGLAGPQSAVSSPNYVP